MPPFHEDNVIRRNERYPTKHTSSSPPLMGPELSRTQHKLQLQRMSFLANDKNYLDHPQNMRRLTKEIDRVNREYRNVRQFEDPLKASLERITQQQQHLPKLVQDNESTSSLSRSNSTNSSTSSSVISHHSAHHHPRKSNDRSQSSNTDLSSSSEKSSFLSRWFASYYHEDAPTSDDDPVAYSFHPTVAHQMKQYRRTTIKNI
ncbi:hypothetical protein A0J61_02438 [Choanephora cucurbitarum]|uniref:Uncharacterized protein n=1 Tax=Choanephora cucurbitarum TaxID=101091 RepID=A0A1C7NQF9_9FUNG|nr:hypothetical protein A0J61_02438 [Choanephora cucurbitarum]